MSDVWSPPVMQWTEVCHTTTQGLYRNVQEALFGESPIQEYHREKREGSVTRAASQGQGRAG